MWNWLERRMQRQEELRSGVDTDLVQDNRRKWKLALGSFGLVGLLLVIDTVFHLRGGFHVAVVFAGAVFLVFGLVAGKWAQAESGFL
jgi:hypothetical protein